MGRRALAAGLSAHGLTTTPPQMKSSGRHDRSDPAPELGDATPEPVTDAPPLGEAVGFASGLLDIDDNVGTPAGIWLSEPIVEPMIVGVPIIPLPIIDVEGPIGGIGGMPMVGEVGVPIVVAGVVPIVDRVGVPIVGDREVPIVGISFIGIDRAMRARFRSQYDDWLSRGRRSRAPLATRDRARCLTTRCARRNML